MAQYKVKIDKQGRIVIPSEVRKILGLKSNSELLLNIKKNTIILEPIHEDIDQLVDDWYEKMLKMKIKAGGLEIKPSLWMDEEYVKRKLGID